MKFLITATALVLFGSAAYAADTFILVAPQPTPKSAEPGSYFIENVPVKQNPMDNGDINQSPIRGKGQIKVSHNEPIPGDQQADLHKAKWLLQDAGYQCSIPNQRMSRR